MLAQVTVTASDFPASLAFYDAVLGALGLVRLAELVDEEEDDGPLEAVGWGEPDTAPVLWLTGAHAPTSGLHLRLAAASRAQVEAFHRAGLATGGVSHSAPRRWALYRRGEFGASLTDPDGNVLEAVAPE